MITLPNLPYGLNDLDPYISKETIEYTTTKNTIKHMWIILMNLFHEWNLKENHSKKSLKVHQLDHIFNNAAQIWNHTFYWESLTPEKNTLSQTDFKKLIERKMGQC